MKFWTQLRWDGQAVAISAICRARRLRTNRSQPSVLVAIDGALEPLQISAKSGDDEEEIDIYEGILTSTSLILSRSLYLSLPLFLSSLSLSLCNVAGIDRDLLEADPMEKAMTAVTAAGTGSSGEVIFGKSPEALEACATRWALAASAK